MVKIKYFGYDHYELNYDLGSGNLIDSHTVAGFNGVEFKSVGGCLRHISSYLGIAYHKNDWCFEKDLTADHEDGWVLHAIINRKTMKLATHKMIESWKKSEKPELIDLLINVFLEDVK